MTSMTSVVAPSAPPSGSSFSRDQLAAFRAMLEQQRAFRVDQLVELSDPASAGQLGEADAEVAAALRFGAKAALHEVQAALWRLDEGRYGRCTGCGAHLGRDRLEILPQVARCMSCQAATRRQVAGAAR